MRNRITQIVTIVLFAWMSLCSDHVYALSDDLVWLTGRVMDESGKHPLSGATIAVYDDKNRVVDYAKTDSDGNYALAVPRSTLHLDKKGGGFFHTVSGLVGGAGKLAALPLKAGIKAAAAASTVGDPLTKIGIGAASGVAQTLADGLAPSKKGPDPLLRNTPGAVVVKVTGAGKNDAVCVGRVYWVEEQTYRTGGKEQSSLTAWLDPVKMTDLSSEKKSVSESKFLTFTQASLTPSIVEVGQSVVIEVSFPTPDEPRTPFIIVARSKETGQIWELTPAGKDKYRTEIVIDKKFPKNDQTITVLAYAAQDDTQGRVKSTEDGLAKGGYFEANKTFIYNPLFVVSRNRAELTLTVVRTGRQK